METTKSKTNESKKNNFSSGVQTFDKEKVKKEILSKKNQFVETPHPIDNHIF